MLEGGLSGNPAAHLVVARAAVDRAITPRDEGDFGHDAALGASGRVHLTRGLTAKAGEDTVANVSLFWLSSPRGSARGAAARAAGRLILQAFARVELLLTGREYEAVATVFTRNFLVNECQLW